LLLGGIKITRYLIRRLGQSVVLVVGLLTVIFLATHVLGDPVLLMLPLEAPEAQYLAVKHAMGFDDPLVVQYIRFASTAIRGDFGDSVWQNVPALPLALHRLPATLWLMFTVMTAATLVGITLGSLSALKPGGRLDHVLTAFTLFGVSIPEFWLALMCMFVFAVELNWLPSSGYSGWDRPEGWRYIALPFMALLPRRVGRVAQIVRTSIADELGRQYVVTAYAKGLYAGAVIFKHVLKNAAIPIVTLAGDELRVLITGTVIIEIVFGWPGVGSLLLDSIQSRDRPLLEATVFIISIMVLLINFSVDMLYTFINPLVKYK
jgi:peptide/nickel transport system permease protein